MDYSSQIVSQLTSAALVVYALQWLKRSKLFPWITAETTTLNRWVGAAAAGLSAIGIHLAFTATAGTPGSYVITVTGLTLPNVLHGVWHWANQYALQQITYDAVTSKAVTAVPAGKEASL